MSKELGNGWWSCAARESLPRGCWVFLVQDMAPCILFFLDTIDFYYIILWYLKIYILVWLISMVGLGGLGGGGVMSEVFPLGYFDARLILSTHNT